VKEWVLSGSEAARPSDLQRRGGRAMRRIPRIGWPRSEGIKQDAPDLAGGTCTYFLYFLMTQGGILKGTIPLYVTSDASGAGFHL
jgi:hypothetical protein